MWRCKWCGRLYDLQHPGCEHTYAPFRVTSGLLADVVVDGTDDAVAPAAGSLFSVEDGRVNAREEFATAWVSQQSVGVLCLVPALPGWEGEGVVAASGEDTAGVEEGGAEGGARPWGGSQCICLRTSSSMVPLLRVLLAMLLIGVAEHEEDDGERDVLDPAMGGSGDAWRVVFVALEWNKSKSEVLRSTFQRKNGSGSMFNWCCCCCWCWCCCKVLWVLCWCCLRSMLACSSCRHVNGSLTQA